MVATLVNVAFGVLIGAALLGAAFDRRSLAIVAVAAAASDLDAVAGLVHEGATNTLFHTIWMPAVIGGVLYYDTTIRERSWLQERWGWWGVRVSWVALTVYVAAGIGADLFAGSGVNLLFPVYDQFLTVDGRFALTVEHERGARHAIVDLHRSLPGIETHGSTRTVAVDSWIAPTDGDRRLRIVEAGWQVVVVGAATAVATIRLRGER